MKFTTNSVAQTIEVGESFGKLLRGGEVIELKSDLGGGKTTFVRGLAAGFGSADPVASPSFTISNIYSRLDGKTLHHFDFYRLSEPGIIANELDEVENDSNNVVVVEWGDIVHDVLPTERIIISLQSTESKNTEVRDWVIVCPDSFDYFLKIPHALISAKETT